MNLEVNLVGVVAATFVAMMVGWVWYSKYAFGVEWMKLQKINEKSMEKNANKAMLGMLILSFVLAYFVASAAFVVDAFMVDTTFVYAAFSTSFWVWLGVVFPVLASNSLFNQAPWKLTAIHAGNWLVTLLGMGLAIGLIGV